MAKKKKEKKKPGGLMGGLISAGFLSEKDARKIRRGQRQERQEAKKEGGHAAIEQLEQSKKAQLAKLQADRKAATEKADQERKELERLERIRSLMRNRLNAAGKSRFYFIRKDRFIDFVDVDDNTNRLLSSRQAAVVKKPGARPGEYELLPVNSKFQELQQLAPEIIMYPASRN